MENESDIVGRTIIKMKGVEKIKYITNLTEGEQPDDPPELPVGNGEKFSAGTWMVRVTDKNAAFSQRVVIANAEQGSGTLGGKPGNTQDVTATQDWYLNIQNDGGKGKVEGFQVQRWADRASLSAVRGLDRQ